MLIVRKDHNISISQNEQGKVYAKSQVTDYICRGVPFEMMNLFTYFVESYEVRTTGETAFCENLQCCTQEHVTVPHPGARIRYLQDHPHHNTRHCAVRAIQHNFLPNFIGSYFPKRNDDDTSDVFFASMMMLFKPWRNLNHDLKHISQSWRSAYESWVSTVTATTRRMIDNIQYYHECQRTDVHTEEDDISALECEGPSDAPLGESTQELFGFSDDTVPPSVSREELHGKMAVNIAQEVGIFASQRASFTMPEEYRGVRTVTREDLASLDKWKAELEHTDPMTGVLSHNSFSIDTGALPDVVHVEENVRSNSSVTTPTVTTQTQTSVENATPSAVMLLKTDQLRAYQIITWHLEETLAERHPPPLRLIVNGEGGTGKSKLIEAVTDYFASRGCRHLLVKMAYTGIAASHIQGVTCHAAAMLSRNDRAMSSRTKTKLQAFWKPVQYEIIDEFSMLGKTFMAKLSRNITIGKAGSIAGLSERSFGGTNMIVTGDEHQFPPVACIPNEALYYPLDSTRDSVLSQIGRSIYEEFGLVVTLKEQIRVIDPIWQDFLHHLCHGQVEPHHIDLLHSLCLTNPECTKPNFKESPWNSSVLITPRHAVRSQWNQQAIQKHCSENHHQLFIIHAEHRTAHRALNTAEEAAIRTHEINKKTDNNELPLTLELAIGMPILITQNLHTEHDITNGARGVIVDIVLDSSQPTPSQSLPTVHLHRPPAFILVRLDHSRAPRFGTETETIIPVSPIIKSFRLRIVENSKEVTRSISRKQLPIAAAYALTDYRAQGQTLGAVFVDLAPPPTGSLSLFNLYVALSRSSGRETIRLLRDFDQRALTASHLPELSSEDDRLAQLNENTFAWWKHLNSTQSTGKNLQTTTLHSF